MRVCKDMLCNGDQNFQQMKSCQAKPTPQIFEIFVQHQNLSNISTGAAKNSILCTLPMLQTSTNKTAEMTIVINVLGNLCTVDNVYKVTQTTKLQYSTKQGCDTHSYKNNVQLRALCAVYDEITMAWKMETELTTQ